ncbi:MAG: sulfatase-like hydrolase/transferase, partial [Deltaproteobacteria bacterium]|nr:sulfatase-like hydrolase/transferase [Deltaproteobacteria bacterium]
MYDCLRSAPRCRRAGLSQGFDIFDEDHRPAESANRTVAHAITRLETLREPFFLWLHVRPPHDPCEIPSEVFDSFYTQRGGGPTLQTHSRSSVLDHYALQEPTANYRVNGRGPELYTASMIQQLEAMYDGNIRQADIAFGKLMDFMNTSGLAERTVVVLGSDHGESMGEHRLFGHNELLQGIVRVPLLLRLPGRGHEVFSHPVMNVDIFPTILALLGIRVEMPVRGIDLFQTERGEYFQFAEYENKRTIKQGNLKLILRGHALYRVQLFDIAKD